MSGSAVAIEVEGVGLTYRSKSGTPTRALESVRCRFEPGKVTAIIGPSGCGKSTLLQIARGFLSASEGRIRYVELSGRAAAKPPAMTTVWQNFNLFPWRSVLDNVAFGLEVAGLARALVMEPDVLLLDEPFGALDAQTRLVLQEQLARLVETSGTTAILVTHSIEEAILLADSILVMTARPGRIAAELAVHLPRPRSMATTHDPAYAVLFNQIYGLLRDEVMRAMVG